MKFHIKDVTRVLSAFVALACCQSAFSQTADDPTTDSQLFEVIVPTLVSITAPDGDAELDLTDDQTDGPHSFDDETWTATSNNASGALITMTAGRFNNDGNTVDAGLAITVSGAEWSVNGDGADTTEGTGTATVTASSEAAGDTDITLTVDFLSGDFADLVSGTYSTTVTGTISANP